MPREVRQIRFDRAEMISALCAYTRVSQKPDINVVDVESFDLRIKEAISILTTKKGAEIEFTNQEILSALVAECGQQNIPLARRLPKRLAAIEEGVALWLGHPPKASKQPAPVQHMIEA